MAKNSKPDGIRKRAEELSKTTGIDADDYEEHIRSRLFHPKEKSQ